MNGQINNFERSMALRRDLWQWAQERDIADMDVLLIGLSEFVSDIIILNPEAKTPSESYNKWAELSKQLFEIKLAQQKGNKDACNN